MKTPLREPSAFTRLVHEFWPCRVDVLVRVLDRKAGQGWLQFFLVFAVLIATAPQIHSQTQSQIDTVVDFDKIRKDPIYHGPGFGLYPVDGLTRGRDGNFYGVSQGDGGQHYGTVYKLTPSGDRTTLVEFTGWDPPYYGGQPLAGLVEADDGYLYGTTSDGGPLWYGTVFRVSPDGDFAIMAGFSGNGTSNKGISPNSRLVIGPDGNFYGTTTGGGSGTTTAFGRGTVFKMTPSGTLSTLAEFTGDSGSTPGSSPQNLILGGDGNFYGTVWGPNRIFQMTSDGEVSTFCEFVGDSESPSSLHPGLDGWIYGTTGGGGDHGFGTVFRISPEGELTTLVHFTKDGVANRGWGPSGLILAQDGNFYGTTSGGGVENFGTAFRMTPSGDLTTLVEFSGQSGLFPGAGPNGALAEGNDGALYGAAAVGGAFHYGTAFRLAANGEFTTLLEFSGTVTKVGSQPSGGVVAGADGSFYGTTHRGGLNDTGTVFRATAEGGIEILASFPLSEIYGGTLPGALVEGEGGTLYGITTRGGAGDHGTVFTLSESGEIVFLVEFTGQAGARPGTEPAGLTAGGDGNLYGTTRTGGGGNHGTVFRVTPSGEFATLAEFSNDGPENKGRHPAAAPWRGSDGHFYGTTQRGGPDDHGTVFRITTGGVLTTLVEFTGNGPENKGSLPNGLMQASDGIFYGSTAAGGTHNFGTVFSMTPEGVLTTLAQTNSPYPYSTLTESTDGMFYFYRRSNSGPVSIASMTPSGTLEGVSTTGFPVSSLNIPLGPFVAGSDGNLYGTAYESVVRLVLPGPPMIYSPAVKVLSNSEANFSARVNARGSTTLVRLEYGLEGEGFPSAFTLAPGLTGFQTTLIGNTKLGLSPGLTYQYRIRATNGESSTLSDVASFTMLAAPIAVALPPSDLGRTSARLHGSIDPRSANTTVSFEWGIDGNTFPYTAIATPGVVSGDDSVAVSTSIAGLTKDTTYHYRLVATNAGGTAVSGTQSFRTLTEPTATIGGSFILSTTSVRVEGSVDPEGSGTSVVFEFGTDGVNYPSSVAATPGTVTGFGGRPVSAVLSNLSQGVTYHYRIRATSVGGVGVSPTASFSMNVLSGFTRVFPGAAPEALGFVLVNLSPAGLLHGWRFVGERRWRPSGVPVGGLTTGDREIEFRSLPGRIHPPTEAVSIVSGEAATVLERTYFETGAVGSGGISVHFKPDSLTAGPDRAQWRLLGEDENAWRDSGETLAGLTPAAYLVECKPVPGRATPPNANVLIGEGQIASPTLTYFLAASGTGAVPVVQAFETVSGDEGKPFAVVGQIRSNAGLSSGFAVKERVVATAAHVVWDEGTLTAAEGLQWLHQRHRGTYEPKPLTPRGFYLLSGYSAQRAAEDTPGSFSPQSRNLDVAAIYFNVEAARGGYGGFLASDLDTNEFLLSPANKTLVGYPVDDFAATAEGRMHATIPFDVSFAPLGPAANRTFFTTGIRSSGGNSGGPLCVQFEGGAYYPAAIYVGGTEQSLVRAIDSDVIELFHRAELSGIDDLPHTGGGITHTSVQSIGEAGTPGALRVMIQPAGAVSAGAGWRLRPESASRNAGAQLGNLNAGRYVLELLAVPGYQIPAPQNVRVVGGQLKTLTFTYALLPVPASAITLRGNERSIGNGDTSPSALDGSDFGLAAIDGGTATRTFSISNPGTAELSLGSIALGGSHPYDFSLSIPPGASIPPGGSTSFTVLFDPSASGTRSATVSFATNVTGSNPFSFAIQGNDETDSNSDGFSDVEESSLAELLARFTVGQSVDLDLSFLRLGSGQVLELLNLPPGLSFDPGTNRITGTISAKAGTPQIEIRKRDGANVDSFVTLDFPVFTPAQVTVSGARPFPATKIRKRSKPQTLFVTNSGELALNRVSVRTTGKAARDYLVTQPAVTTLDANASTTFTVTFKPRSKGNRRASVTIFSSTAPVSVPVSGKGK